MNARNSLTPSTVLLLALAFLAGVAGVALAPAPIPKAPRSDNWKVPPPPQPFARMPLPYTGDDSSGSGTSGKAKMFMKYYHEMRRWKGRHINIAKSRMEADFIGDTKGLISCRSLELNAEQRARLEATIKMYEDARADLIAMAGLMVRLKVETALLRQVSEDVPKVVVALDTALDVVLEKLDEAAKRRDKGEDAGLPERIAITILENVLDAFGNMKKDTEKILNDAKRTPKHYKEELARLTGRLAAACAAFEQTAGQVEALRADNAKAMARLAKARGGMMNVAKEGSRAVKVKAGAITRHNYVFGLNGSGAVKGLVKEVSQTKVEIK